jgi:hypothetical protein
MEGKIARYVALPGGITRYQMVDLIAAVRRNVYVSYLDPKVPLRVALREEIDPSRPHHILYGRLRSVSRMGVSLDKMQMLPFSAMPAIGIAGEKREGGVLIVRDAEGGELLYANPKRAERLAALTESQRELIEKEETMVRLLSSREQIESDRALGEQLQLLRDSFTSMHAKGKPKPSPA